MSRARRLTPEEWRRLAEAVDQLGAGFRGLALAARQASLTIGETARLMGLFAAGIIEIRPNERVDGITFQEIEFVVYDALRPNSPYGGKDAEESNRNRQDSRVR